jgi:hypothetical protein
VTIALYGFKGIGCVTRTIDMDSFFISNIIKAEAIGYT